MQAGLAPGSAGCTASAGETYNGAIISHKAIDTRCTNELAEARACLRDVYARFTEGFAFPDLQDASALIGPGKEAPRQA